MEFEKSIEAFMQFAVSKTVLNETENYSTLGSLFEHLADDSAVITYAHRLWDFFQGLFRVSFSKIFHLTLNT